MSEIIIRYATMVVLAALAVLLVLTGHDSSTITSVIGAAFTFIVGVLFRDTLSVQNKLNNPTGGNGTGAN